MVGKQAQVCGGVCVVCPCGGGENQPNQMEMSKMVQGKKAMHKNQHQSVMSKSGEVGNVSHGGVGTVQQAKGCVVWER